MCDKSELIIMVADGNSKSRDLMCEALEQHGLSNIICAETVAQGVNIANSLNDKNKKISILFCHTQIQDLPISFFVKLLRKVNQNMFTITYSDVFSPEDHILSLFKMGSMDHIAQTEDFDKEVSTVIDRWVPAAILNFDFSEKYERKRATV